MAGGIRKERSAVARWTREVLWTGEAATGTVGDCWSVSGVGGAYVGYIGDMCTCNPDVVVDWL